MPTDVLRQMRSLSGAATVAIAFISTFGVRTTAAATEPSQRERSEPRPNIVVFLADDLGLRDIGPYGNREVRTPNLDRLAKNGVAFDRAFVASPACAPSRAALLTGLMPARNGAEVNQAAPNRWVRKLPSYLQTQGYQVVAFGKVAHYRQTDQYGFDHFEHDTFHDPDGIDAAVTWLRARKDPRPLAIFVGSNWPHVPWPKTTEGYEPARVTLPGKSIDTPVTRNARARYYAAVTQLDDELGKVLSASDRALGPDTFVLFSSDHGAQWPFGKWNLYDSGIQVPLIVRWRGKAAAGSRTQAMISWVDILPTLADVAGGEAPKDVDGVSFVQVIRNAATVARTEIFTTHTGDGRVNVYPIRSVRTERYKYIRNQHPEWIYTTHIDQFVDRLDSGAYWPSWTVAAQSDASAKRIVDHYYRRPAEELYDLQADPGETRNLAGEPAAEATLVILRAKLDAWQMQQGDTMRRPSTQPHLTRDRTATD